jgi:hypothetical protein
VADRPAGADLPVYPLRVGRLRSGQAVQGAGWPVPPITTGWAARTIRAGRWWKSLPGERDLRRLAALTRPLRCAPSDRRPNTSKGRRSVSSCARSLYHDDHRDQDARECSNGEVKRSVLHRRQWAALSPFVCFGSGWLPQDRRGRSDPSETTGDVVLPLFEKCERSHDVRALPQPDPCVRHQRWFGPSGRASFRRPGRQQRQSRPRARRWS